MGLVLAAVKRRVVLPAAPAGDESLPPTAPSAHVVLVLALQLWRTGCTVAQGVPLPREPASPKLRGRSHSPSRKQAALLPEVGRDHCLASVEEALGPALHEGKSLVEPPETMSRSPRATEVTWDVLAPHVVGF